MPYPLRTLCAIGGMFAAAWSIVVGLSGDVGTAAFFLGSAACLWVAALA